MERQLYRSRENKMIAGVCGGIGEYFNIDPTIVRFIWVIFTLTYGLGLIAYIVAAIVIPERFGYSQGESYGSSNEGQNKEPVKVDNSRTNVIIGGILIVLGMILIGRHFFRWIDSGIIWSLLFIAVGLFVIFNGRRK